MDTFWVFSLTGVEFLRRRQLGGLSRDHSSVLRGQLSHMRLQSRQRLPARVGNEHRWDDAVRDAGGSRRGWGRSDGEERRDGPWERRDSDAGRDVGGRLRGEERGSDGGHGGRTATSHVEPAPRPLVCEQ